MPPYSGIRHIITYEPAINYPIYYRIWYNIESNLNMSEAKMDDPQAPMKMIQLAGKTAPNLRVAILAHEIDRTEARKLVQLFRKNAILCWTEDELLPGQDWRLETERAYREADFILVLISKKSVHLESVYQKHIKTALEAGSEKPESGIKTIPVRLDECNIPFVLREIYSVNWWEKNASLRLILAWAKEWQRRYDANDWPKIKYVVRWK